MQPKAGNAKPNHDSVVYLVAATERGTKPGEMVLLLVSDPSDAIENSVTELAPTFPTKRNFPSGSTATKPGFVPAFTEAVVNAVRAPAAPIANCETVAEPELAT